MKKGAKMLRIKTSEQLGHAHLNQAPLFAFLKESKGGLDSGKQKFEVGMG